MSLRAAWDANAGDWIRWARSPQLDHGFWRMGLPWLLDLLPPPGRLTLDVGCGEGRLARVLHARGHNVLGVEPSPALVSVARGGEPAIEVLGGDAAAMPLDDGAADLAVASMVLMNVDDMPVVVAEVARVLEPGGAFVFSVVHPVNSMGDAEAGYFETVRYSETLRASDAELTVHETHRPLGAYFSALAAAGFLVERLAEPVPDDAHVEDHPEAARWRERPSFMLVKAVRRP